MSPRSARPSLFSLAPLGKNYSAMQLPNVARRFNTFGWRLLTRAWPRSTKRDAGSWLTREFMSDQKASNEKRFLFVAYFDPNGISTISENIQQWCSKSRFRYDLVNLYFAENKSGLSIPGSVNLNDYDGVVVHCTAAYNPGNLERLDQQLNPKIKDYRGTKILMKQDEHLRPHTTAEYLGSRRFDMLISCAIPSEFPILYPKRLVGDLKFLPALTAFVSDQMRSLRPSPFVERETDIGYRGSMQPWNFGRLAFEKQEIGDRFIEICLSHSLSYDISSRWEDRFTGAKWFEFLCSIKAVLGVESGASIIDFDVTVEHECNEFLKRHPGASFEEVSRNVLQRYEDNGYYKAISPRHLEATACKTVQILYEGNYSGIFKPDLHYISLRRDFSNASDVVRRLKDSTYCEDVTDRAYEEIILNPEYQYSWFVKSYDEMVTFLLHQALA